MNEKLEFYWHILNKTHDHIKFSDAKAALLLSLYGIIISLYFTQSSTFINEVIKVSSFKMILLIIIGILSLLSIYCAFNAVNPRLKNPTSTSVIYFGDVHKEFKSADEYYQFGNEIFDKPEAVFRDLSDQVYVNSTIAYKKFYNVAWAIRFFVAGLVIFLLLVFI